MKQYIEIMEDGEVFRLKESDLSLEIQSSDAGIVQIIDITDPTKPLLYTDDGWIELDFLEIVEGE